MVHRRSGIKCGVRFDDSPYDSDGSPRSSTRSALLTFVADQLRQRAVGFTLIRQAETDERMLGRIKQAFDGPVIANEKLTRDAVERLMSYGCAYAVA